MSSDESTPEDAGEEILHRWQRAVEGGRLDEASDAAAEMLAFAAEWAQQDPSPDFVLTIAASECEENGDWAGAESKYEQNLALPDTAAHVKSRAHSHLATLYRLLRRDADALDHARRASAVARRVDMPIHLSAALQLEARCLIGCGRVADARKVVEEALSAIGDDAMVGQIRAKCLTLRAECALLDGDALGDIERDLDQAFALLTPLAQMETAAGVHIDCAQWWSMAARLAATRHEADGSIGAWKRAVSTSMHVIELPQATSVYTKAMVADMLEGLASALRASGRADEAAAALVERQEILQAIGVPDRGAEES